VQNGIVQQIKGQLRQQFFITGQCYVQVNVCLDVFSLFLATGYNASVTEVTIWLRLTGLKALRREPDSIWEILSMAEKVSRILSTSSIA